MQTYGIKSHLDALPLATPLDSDHTTNSAFEKNSTPSTWKVAVITPRQCWGGFFKDVRLTGDIIGSVENRTQRDKSMSYAVQCRHVRITKLN